MKDRMVAGMASGAIGALALNGWSLFSYYVLHLTRLRNLDLMAVVVLGHPAKGIGQILASLLYDFIFAAAVGGLFALALPFVGPQFLTLKVWFWGTVVSLMSFTATTLFRVPHLVDIPYPTVLSHFLDATAWGLLTSYALTRLLVVHSTAGPGPTG